MTLFPSKKKRAENGAQWECSHNNKAKSAQKNCGVMQNCDNPSKSKSKTVMQKHKRHVNNRYKANIVYLYVYGSISCNIIGITVKAIGDTVYVSM